LRDRDRGLKMLAADADTDLASKLNQTKATQTTDADTDLASLFFSFVFENLKLCVWHTVRP
jgi:hypothetical protein